MKAWFLALSQRDLRALLALVASILGTMALTGVAIWITFILWRGGWTVGTEGQRIDKIGLALVLVLVIMGLTMLGLGLAINKRSAKITLPGGISADISGGDAEAVATAAVKAAAVSNQESSNA